MTDVFAQVNGVLVADVMLSVPQKGPWFADLVFASADEVSADTDGKWVLTLGKSTWTGSLIDGGAFALGRRARLVAGNGGWGGSVAPLGYHNDAGVKALVIARDAATAAGETLGTFEPESATLGIDYARQLAPASQALEDAIGSSLWWVDSDGVTNVGAHAEHEPDPELVRVLSYDTHGDNALLSVSDPSDVRIGSVLSDDSLPAAKTIRSLLITAKSGKLDVKAWCGTSDSSGDALTHVIERIVRKALDARLLGVYRYRVTTMATERCNLQLVNTAAGLPSALSNVSMWSAGGYHTTCTPGCEVLVAFVDGKRSAPVIIAFAGRMQGGHVPESVEIGGDGATPLARVGDTCTVYFPPTMTVSGLLSGSPFTGTIFVAQAATGVINTGCTVAKGA